MSTQVFSLGTNLVVIRHPEKGDAENGKIICDHIRGKLADGSDPVCLFHDATGMATANTGYAGAFKDLDKEISGRVIEVVCAIPGSIPRMMAHTVAMFSEKKWSIFKTRQESEEYLKSKGYSVADVSHPADGPVGLKKLT